MQPEHVLFPFDFSDRCRHAALHVKSWVQKNGARLTILNVIEDPSAHYPASAKFLVPPKERDQILASSGRFLLRYARETFSEEVDTTCRMGDPSKEIVCVATETHANLIMMPTRGGGRFRAFLLGSVTVKVLNDAECPVWTDAHMEQAGRDADLEIRSILCAVDDKEESVWIVKRAAGLADLYSAKLNLLRVVPEIDVRNETLRTEWQQELIESARLQLSELRHHTGVTAEIQVSSGSISHAIRKTALECNSNLVVIGRGHAQGLLGRLRTNAYAIIRDSPCPVLSF